MARYKPYDLGQRKLIPILFEAQILPGTFEHTHSQFINQELELWRFDQKHNNDETGAAACEPRILLEIVLYAYAKGILSSRRIARACQDNVVLTALSAGSQPYFTSIAAFISGSSTQIQRLFREVIVAAERFGQAREHHHLEPIIDAIKEAFFRIGLGKDVFTSHKAKLTADAGFHTAGNVAQLEEDGIDAYLADKQIPPARPTLQRSVRAKPQKQRAQQHPGREHEAQDRQPAGPAPLQPVRGRRRARLRQYGSYAQNESVFASREEKRSMVSGTSLRLCTTSGRARRLLRGLHKALIARDYCRKKRYGSAIVIA